MADAFFQHIVCRFGMPSVIHSDQGREFENKVMQELCLLCGAHKTRMTPDTTLVERFNITLPMMLAGPDNEPMLYGSVMHWRWPMTRSVGTRDRRCGDRRGSMIMMIGELSDGCCGGRLGPPLLLPCQDM